MRFTPLLIVLIVAVGCSAPPREIADLRGDDPFLDTLQANTFAWFWETTNPRNGLVPDRAPSRPFSSIAAVGFGLTAYGIGAERGYITREQARERTLATLRFFWNAPQGPEPRGITGDRGFFYHFLDMETGERFQTTELSTIDTALMLMGALFSREYFDGSHAEEAEIRALADSLYFRARWDEFQPRAPLIAMSHRPERGMSDYDYKGFDEAMFLYILGLGSPTHPVHPDAWEAFTSSYLWGEYYGEEYVQFSPLFGYHYAHVWIDPRGLQDAYMREKGIDYFENARRATYAHRNYAIANPRGFRDYGEDNWGLTACDGPGGGMLPVNGDSVRFQTYSARGVSLKYTNDDGTIAPTAAGGSIAYAPEITIPALKVMRARYGSRVFNDHGFVDAFNPTFRFTDIQLNRGSVDPEYGWFDDDHLGIDQGPILAMAENYRSGFVWDVMKKSPHIARGLCKAGFTAEWLACE